MTQSNLAVQEQPVVQKALVRLAIRVLRPLVRILMRHGMSSVEFSEISRWVFVDVAMSDAQFALPQRRQSKSRVAVLTGLSRKEVLRLTEMSSPDEAQDFASSNRAARVLTGWTENPMFSDDKDQPRALALKKGAPSFADLVRMYSGDMPYRVVLDELIRSGAVELEGDRVRLRKLSYFPSSGSEEQLQIVAMCASDLISTMEHNCRPGCTVKFPQRAVYSSRVPEEALPTVREFIRKETDALARRVHHFITDISDHVKEPTVRHHRAGLGLYYFES